jgi:hypothetical protein
VGYHGPGSCFRCQQNVCGHCLEMADEWPQSEVSRSLAKVCGGSNWVTSRQMTQRSRVRLGLRFAIAGEERMRPSRAFAGEVRDDE